MRVIEETLSRGWVGMGWWPSGLLVGAYNTIRQQHFLLQPCVSAHFFFNGDWVRGGGVGVV